MIPRVRYGVRRVGFASRSGITREGLYRAARPAIVSLRLNTKRGREEDEVLDTVRKYVEAGMGALSSKRAEELAKTLVKRGEAGKEQATRIARDLADWSKKSRDRLTRVVQREVKKQVGALGFATKGEIESLRKRVRSLEGKARTPTKRASSKK
jgi:polyhydroxyalkanoate synthesis regulator phasin